MLTLILMLVLASLVRTDIKDTEGGNGNMGKRCFKASENDYSGH